MANTPKSLHRLLHAWNSHARCSTMQVQGARCYCYRTISPDRAAMSCAFEVVFAGLSARSTNCSDARAPSSTALVRCSTASSSIRLCRRLSTLRLRRIGPRGPPAWIALTSTLVPLDPWHTTDGVRGRSAKPAKRRRRRASNAAPSAFDSHSTHEVVGRECKLLEARHRAELQRRRNRRGSLVAHVGWLQMEFGARIQLRVDAQRGIHSSAQRAWESPTAPARAGHQHAPAHPSCAPPQERRSAHCFGSTRPHPATAANF
eukprot:3505158-Prymnesium_polylepis.2